MNVSLDGWSINIRGAWNPRIFTPEWLIRHIFAEGQEPDPGTQIKVEFPLQSGQPYRYSMAGIRIIPSLSRVVLAPLDHADATLMTLERAAIALLNTLSHTPISAFGLNFRFVEEHPEDDVLELFRTQADVGRYATTGKAVEEQSLTRRMDVDRSRLAVTVAWGGDEGVVADFNFHRDAASCEHAVELLTGTVARDLATATGILTEVYHFELVMEAAQHE